MKKRGQIILKPLIEMLVAAAIFLLFYYIGASYGTGEVFQKISIAEDNAATMNVLYGLPDNADLSNLGGLEKYTISFDSSSAKIGVIDNDPTQARRFFSKTDCPDLNLNFKNKKVLAFGKSGNCVEVTDSKLSSKQRCPSVEMTMPAKTKIIPKTINSQDYLFTEALAANILNGETADLQGLEDDQAAILEIITSENKGIKIYTAPNLKSRKLACLIANSITGKNSDLSITIVPSDRTSLTRSEIAIAIELGKEYETTDTINKIADGFRMI